VGVEIDEIDEIDGGALNGMKQGALGLSCDVSEAWRFRLGI